MTIFADAKYGAALQKLANDFVSSVDGTTERAGYNFTGIDFGTEDQP